MLRQFSNDERAGREQRLMKEGKKKYMAELVKQVIQLKELIEPSEAGPSFEAAGTIYRLVHTLKGSAPMFGFVRIGSVAERLVELWEWAQHESGAGGTTERDYDRQLHICVQMTKPLVGELELELEVYRRELELDEVQDRLYLSGMQPGGERLLVIDDDEGLRSFLVRRLRLDGYEVDEASDVATARRLLRENSYHLITLDLMMHPVTGYELFELLKDDPTLKWVPLIVLSGKNDVNDKVRCFYLGADDYVTKPFQYEELHARIYGLLKRTRTFEQMAFRDPLTGAYNRRFFDHQIRVELQRIARFPAPISLVFIDIDRFKSINDTYGHHVGDQVLQGLAHLLQQHLRATDLLARFGGEEFVIVLPNSGGADARRTIEGILQQAHRAPVAQHDDQLFHITFSAGVCEWSGGMSVEAWIATADEAMYEAKQTGRNRVVLANAPAAAEQDASAPREAPREKKVLIADDDKILRTILIAKLKHLQVEFFEAADGEAAFQTLTKERIDLCILDAVMPRLDGYGVLSRLKEQGCRPEGMRVLVLSGRSREEDIRRSLELGADAYMHKPFSMVELEHQVKELLELPTV